MCASLVGICARWSGKLGLCSTLLTSKPVTFLGGISYMVYLLHLQMYMVVGLLFMRLLGRSLVTSGRGLGFLGAVLATAAIITIAGLSWKYLEVPILQYKNTLFPLRNLTADVPVAPRIDPNRRVGV
jgi:peptidoglycan/LPS O-acetylase OafA/YrhL